MGTVGTRTQTFGLKTLMEDWVLKKTEWEVVDWIHLADSVVQ